MKLNYIHIICFLFTINNGFAQQLAIPISNYNSGIYLSAISVELSHPEPGVTLFYTLNGNIPTPSDMIYTGPILLSNRDGEANTHSMIETNPSFVYPMGNYDENRANNRGWLAPYAEIYKFNILRVRAYKPGFAASEVLSKTIIIDPIGVGLYSMPILSIVMDSIDLFSASDGIYVYGNHPDGNYTQKGVDWEKIGHLDLFDTNGNLVLSKTPRVRGHGGGSRHSTKKSFRLYGDTDGENNFNYPFFKNYELSKYKRILIKSGGHRPDCFPRDDLGNMITNGLNVEQQHFRHVILFVNGEYWGIHTIKERFDKYYFQNIYGIDDDEITVLDQEYDVQDGYGSDSLEMKMLESFVDLNDMTDPTNYQYVLDRVDVENYIDYMCSEIFLSNEDWVYSNVVIWKRTGGYNPELGAGYDGKFRWALYDLDGAFGGSCSNAYYTVNTLNAATVETGTFSSYSRFFRGILGNPEFKRSFVSRMCDLMNSHFKNTVLDQKMDSIYNMLTPEMSENVKRWRYPSEANTLLARSTETPSLIQWDTTFYYLHRFANRRQRKIREHIMAKWGYPDTSIISVNVNNQSMGNVKVNTILINSQLLGTEPGIYPWSGNYIDSVTIPLVAIPLPGYEFVEWLESGNTNDTIYWTPNGDSLFTAIFQASSGYSQILINEVMSSNAGYLDDNYGDSDDWLELFNPNPYAIEISNCQLKRDFTEWTIPNGTIIPANGYLIFWHDKETYQGNNHVNFKLINDVDTVFFISPNGIIMDEFAYPQTTSNFSYGRYPNGSSTFSIFSYPTPLQNNDVSGLENSESANYLSVYPNPSNDIMNFNKTISYTLFDLNGRIIRKEFNKNKIEVSELESGIYILESSEGESIKLIVRN